MGSELPLIIEKLSFRYRRREEFALREIDAARETLSIATERANDAAFDLEQAMDGRCPICGSEV